MCEAISGGELGVVGSGECDLSMHWRCDGAPGSFCLQGIQHRVILRCAGGDGNFGALTTWAGGEANISQHAFGQRVGAILALYGGTGAWNRGYCLCADGSTAVADICYCRSVHRVSDSQANVAGLCDCAGVSGDRIAVGVDGSDVDGGGACGRGGVAAVCGDEYGGDCCAAGGGVGAGGEFSGVVTDGVEQWGMDVQGGHCAADTGGNCGQRGGSDAVLRVFDGESGGTGDAVGAGTLAGSEM